MSQYSRYNIVYRLQKWMDSVPGQTFMNYAYSWGASIVILGTLFKLTHLPGANIMLFLGMGTEVFVFFISAFDRPFDKTQDGKELPTSRSRAAVADDEYEGFEPAATAVDVVGVDTPHIGGTGIAGGGSIVIGNVGGSVATEGAVPAVSTEGTGGNGPVVIGGGAVPVTPAPAVTAETAAAMEEATSTYVERLNELNEVLIKVAAQSDRLTKDSEEMENLNRTLTGIAKVYEMQLKSASQQIGTIDEINEKTKNMAQQIEQLNTIYARMIEAMTVNMPGAAGAKV